MSLADRAESFIKQADETGRALDQLLENEVSESHTEPAQPRWPQIDSAAFHGLAGDVVRTIEPHSEADPVALLVQFMTAFGNAVGRGPYFQVESDHHYPNLFAVMTGDSSKSRKGTSWGRIRRLFEIADDNWADECTESGLSSGEGLVWRLRDPVDEDDPGVNDKRLMVIESEFAGVLRVLGRQGNTLSRMIRDAWDRGTLGSMTKNARTTAENVHVSIVGHITADELRRYLDRTEAANGFSNRFIYVAVRRSKYLPFGGDLKDGDLQMLARRLSVALGNACRMDAVSMSDDAKETWRSVYPELSEGQPGLMGAITGRAEAQVIRLALVYALCDGVEVIGRDHLMAALALWDYAEESARYIWGQTLGDPIADEIQRELDKAAPDGLTRTDLLHHFKRHKSAAQIGRALDLLHQHRRAYPEKRAGQGRPVEVWFAGGGGHG